MGMAALHSNSAMDATLAVDSSLQVKLVSLVALFFTTLSCGYSALCFVGGRLFNADPGIRRRGLSLVSCCTAGVFLATCLLDLVPNYLVEINKSFSAFDITLQFPLPEFIMTMGFILVLVMEQIMLAYKDQSETSGREWQALLVESSFQPQHHMHRREEGTAAHLHVDFNSHSPMRSFVLVVSLSLHSVLEGLTAGLQRDQNRAQETCLALMLRKGVVAFSLVLKLTQDRLRRAAVLSCLLLFSLMSPLGMGVSMGMSKVQAPHQHHMACSTLEGLAVGALIYITFMEILPHELGSPYNRIPKVAMLLTGFALVAGILFVKI